MSPAFDHERDPVRRIRAHGHLIARQEIQQALTKVEARGDLTDGQRLVVEAMAHRIADSVLADPAEMLAAENTDPEAARAVASLFDPDEWPRRDLSHE